MTNKIIPGVIYKNGYGIKKFFITIGDYIDRGSLNVKYLTMEDVFGRKAAFVDTIGYTYSEDGKFLGIPDDEIGHHIVFEEDDKMQNEEIKIKIVKKLENQIYDDLVGVDDNEIYLHNSLKTKDQIERTIKILQKILDTGVFE